MASVILSRFFESQLKRLSKKFPSLKNEFPILVESLKSDPAQGVFLGRNSYKIRLAIASKGRGKSGGARIITCFQVLGDQVYLLSIFDKSERESIADHELDELLKEMGLEQNP